MLRFIPILLLMLQALPMATVAETAQESAHAPQKMSCCGGCCQCAKNGCQCGKKQDKAPSPSKTPFLITSIDFAPPLAPAKYAVPALSVIGEIQFEALSQNVACSNNCRQALLGRWQN